MTEEEGNRESEGEHQEEQARRAGWLSLFKFTLKRHFPTLAIALVLSVVSGIVIPVVAIILGRIFNLFTDFASGSLTGPDLIARVSLSCIALVGLGAGSWALNGGYFMFWLVFGELQAKSVRDRLFDGLMQKDMEWYDMRKDGVSALIPRVQSQIRELQLATSQPLGFALQYTVTALAALGVALYHSWKLTFVTIATFPLAALILSYISTKMQPSISHQVERLAQASKLSSNSISAIETVKCFNGQEHEIRQYAKKIREAARNYLIQANANALQVGFVRLITLGMFVQGFWYGSTLVGPDGATAGQVLTTFWAALMATQALEQLLPQIIVLEKGRAAGATLHAIIFRMERGRIIIPMIGGRTPEICHGDIELLNVSFSYPTQPDIRALNKVNFFFPAGEMVFVVGSSGSGKSTLGNLIMQYYKQWSGSISIDGNPIQTLDLGWLRRNVTLVQQQSELFNETIFRNVAFGCTDPDQVSIFEVSEACQAALLQSTISDLPDGLETVVGTGGVSMSGGQKQRIAIARARLRNSPIMILDEPTSALDYVSRSLMMDALREWRRGKTTIIVTHEISQIHEYDYVYVMDKGKVAQEGYKKSLDKDHAGLFFALLRGGPNSTLPSEHVGSQANNSSQQRTTRSTSEGGVLREEGSPSASVDSLDIQFPQNVQYIPTMFRGSVTDLRYRRPSANFMSPVTPLSASLSPRVRLPKGMEAVELAGRTTLANRQERHGDRPRTVYSGFLSSDRILQQTHQGEGDDTRHRFVNLKNRKKAGKKRIAALKDILATVWPNLDGRARCILVLGFISALLHAAATPVFSFFFAKLLATFFLQTDRSKEALKWSLAVLGVAVGDAVASYLMHFLLETCGQAWTDRIRIEAFKRILAQPRSWFDEGKNSVSRLSECLDRNAEEMRNLVGRFAGFVVVATAMTLLAVVWSFAISWRLTIVGIASAPVMYAITTGFEFVSGKWEGKSNDAAEGAGAILMETFSNVRLVRALTLETFFWKKYAKTTRETLKVGLKRSAYSGLFYGLSDSGILFITALIFYYGAVLVSSKQHSTTDILTVFTMLTFSIANANFIVSFVPQINSSRDTATRLLRLAHLPSASYESSGLRRPTSVLPIAFEKFSFSYPSRPAQLCLDNITLEFRAGSSTAIVGASGSGKSTLASILVGLYPSDHAYSLSYNGTPATTINISYLRSQIAIIAQHPSLFPSSIAANIAYGLPARSYSQRDITAAASQAGIHDFISSLPQGYSTRIGEGGQGLSGGQAQRIAIARALIRRPQVLVLDEATSALDLENARVIQQTVRDLVATTPHLATIIITHDRELMRVAQRLVVLDRGRVREMGTWKELMGKQDGELRRLLDGGRGGGEGGDVSGQNGGGGVGMKWDYWNWM